jgi:hypothetical protein
MICSGFIFQSSFSSKFFIWTGDLQPLRVVGVPLTGGVHIKLKNGSNWEENMKGGKK